MKGLTSVLEKISCVCGSQYSTQWQKFFEQEKLWLQRYVYLMGQFSTYIT
jgi:hypothetical protein